MDWIEIFILTAKWVSAIWAGVLAAALLGFAVLGALIGLGGILTRAEPLWKQTPGQDELRQSLE